jgi:hypothetical protein
VILVLSGLIQEVLCPLASSYASFAIACHRHLKHYLLISFHEEISLASPGRVSNALKLSFGASTSRFMTDGQ